MSSDSSEEEYSVNPENDLIKNKVHDESSSKDEEELLQGNGERIWAAISFVIIIIVIGIPLWWTLTKVERSYFPYSDIEDLRFEKIHFPVNINIYVQKASADNIKETLDLHFRRSTLYYANVQTTVSEILSVKSLAELESLDEIHQQRFGNIQLIEVNSLKSGEIIMGKHRTAYFAETIDPQKIYSFLQEVLLHEEIFKESIVAVISPGSVSENIYYLRKLRPSPKYDVVFTVVNPQPEKIQFDWNNQKAIKSYFQPTIENLSSLSEFRIKSQWLYLINLQQIPKKQDDYFVLNEKQIPHIITPLEKKIGSGVAQNPCINFVLYISRCEYSPTLFTDASGILSNSVLSARWGGVQIVNPNETVCDESSTLVGNPERIMLTFLFQFRSLLGLKDFTSSPLVLPNNELAIYPWEVDALYRMRILELFVSSRMTLASLSQLLGEISNIVITDEVGDAVMNAVSAAQNTVQSLVQNDLIAALNFSTSAFISSEFAFTHPSLLALLYFPDDQKYAVYIPLYLPVMIPVLLSLKNVIIWLQKELLKKPK